MPVRTYNVFATYPEVMVIVNQALGHLPKMDIEVKLIFARPGNGLFDNPAVSAFATVGERKITINLDWYETTDEKDLHYVIWHEVRHLYQGIQCERLVKGETTASPEEHIRKWYYNFTHYIPNTPATEEAHMRQEMEIDGYAFAFYMLAHYFREPNGDVLIGLPPWTEEDILNRAETALKRNLNIYLD